jgi:hypothetical protein
MDLRISQDIYTSLILGLFDNKNCVIFKAGLEPLVLSLKFIEFLDSLGPNHCPPYGLSDRAHI